MKIPRTVRKCSICKTTKPLAEFVKNRKKTYGHTYECKECWRDYIFLTRDNGDKYGITSQEYKHLLSLQEGKCAICLNFETALSKYGKVKRLAIDHDHKTGKVRGLLCQRCNITLAHVEKDRLISEKAIKYLEKYENQ